MAVILDEKQVEDFIKEHHIEAFSIIVKIDEKNRKASYIIDGSKEVEGNYDVLINYFKKNI